MVHLEFNVLIVKHLIKHVKTHNDKLKNGTTMQNPWSVLHCAMDG